MSNDEPELEFWDKMPTAWDETKVIDGTPGEFITTARRTGNDWFVGTITNNNARTIKLSFSFLPKGKKYIAHIYSDDESVNTNTHVKVETKNVDASTVLDVKLMESGGEAIWLEPAK